MTATPVTAQSLKGKSLADKIAAINADESLTAQEKQDYAAELRKAEYGPSSFDIGEFEDLLGKLEGSKMRQQRQKSVEGRRDIFAGGMANMMSNF